MTSQQLSDREPKLKTVPASIKLAGGIITSAVGSGLRLNSIARRRLGILWYSFIIAVCLPAIVYFAYLLLIASAEYEAEARFAVRAPNEGRGQAITEALASLSSMVGGRSTVQDSFIVADYIRSRTIIEDLGGKGVVENVYSRGDADWFSRLTTSQTLEDVWEYWRRKVTAVIDTQSSVITLRVRAFTPDDAKNLADRIVQRSELLVNEISERARRDALARAQTEVDIALQRLAKIRAALLEFRTGVSTIDPVGSAASLNETLVALNREKIALEGNRDSLKGVMDKDAPTLRFLASRIESIEG